MTSAREITSYFLSHLMGFVLSSLLTTFVLLPIYMSPQIARSAWNRYTLSFVAFAVVQAIVFGAFIMMRGRSGRPE